MTPKLVGDWRPLRDALDEAYTALDIAKPADESLSFSEQHWDIGVVLWNAFQDYSQRTGGACTSCKTPLNFQTVIRCLDCKSPLCEHCAPAHFGPQHGARTQAAHPAPQAKEDPPLQMILEQTCTACAGIGRFGDFAYAQLCPNCNGNGKVRKFVPRPLEAPDA